MISFRIFRPASNLCRRVRNFSASRKRSIKLKLYIAKNFKVVRSKKLNYQFLYMWHNLRVRDLVANQSSFGKYGADELIKEISIMSSGLGPRAVAEDFQPVLLLEFARMSALQPRNEDDIRHAFEVYSFVFANFQNWKSLPSTRVSPRHDFTFLHVCYMTHQFKEWQLFAQMYQSIGLTKMAIEIDSKHPMISGDSLNNETWLQAFNVIFDQHGIERIQLVSDTSAGNDISLDAIECLPAETVHGELVTVIVTAFNPGKELLTSIKSLLNQSWKNLEIILVDDDSSDSTFIEMSGLLDSRIKIIRQSKNEGTYSARNTALDVATGTFITFQDSDDWSHARRVEIQVSELIQNQELKATYAKAVRLPPDLLFTGRGGVPWRETNFSSLMFRSSVFHELGYFDSVRKAADSEYLSRIRSHYSNGTNHNPVQVCSDAYLSIIRIGHASLSRSDFQTNWMHPARIHYRQAFTAWHKSCKENGTTPRIEIKADTRKFPCPSLFEIDHIETELNSADIIFAIDMSVKDRFISQQIAAALISGLRVCLLNMIPENGKTKVDESFSKMINDFSVRLITPDEFVRCRHLVIRTLRIFQFPGVLPWNIAYDDISVISNDSYCAYKARIKQAGTYKLWRELVSKKSLVEINDVLRNAPIDLNQANWFTHSAKNGSILKMVHIDSNSISDFDLSGPKNLEPNDILSL
jgi:glycosyltransferase involved in cell wall biosynthesis